MAVSGGPKIITDNLAVLLDVANRKSYVPYSNIINPGTWTVSSGSVTGFNRNGTVDENNRFYSTDPWGKTGLIWEAVTDGLNDGSGGWNGDYFSVDPTKMYRFTTWVNRTVQGNGNFYLGLNNRNSSGTNIGVLDGNTGVVSTNPYFWVSSSPPGESELPTDTWVLVVAHVWPEGSPTGSLRPDSGVYTVASGRFRGITRDYIWNTGTVDARHRTYLFYSTNTTTRQRWILPRVDIVDGTEPTVQQLLDNGPDSIKDLTGNLNNGSLINVPQYGADFGGYLTFDGVNDYLTTGTTPTGLTGNPSFTAMGWFRRKANFSSRGMWGIGGNASLQGINNWNSTATNAIAIDLWGTSTFSTGQTFPLNEWIFVAWQKVTGAFSRANITIWVNDTPYTGTQMSILRGGETSTPNINNQGLVLGTINSTLFSTYPVNFDVANFQVYTRVLTPNEIIQNFNATRSRFGV